MQTAAERAKQCVQEFEKEELSLSTSEYNTLVDKVELFLKEQDKLTRHAIAEKLAEKASEIIDEQNYSTTYMAESYKDAHQIAMNTHAV